MAQSALHIEPIYLYGQVSESEFSSSYGDFDPQSLLRNGPDILRHLSSDQQVLSQPGAWSN